MPEQQPLELDSTQAVALNRPDMESAGAITEQAMALTITDQLSADTAALWRNQQKTWMDSNTKLKELDDKISEANSLHKYLCSIRNSIVNPRNDAIKLVDRKINEWLTAEKLKVEAEKRRLEAIAYQKEEDRRLKEAALAEKRGDHAQAEAIIEAPMVVAAPNIPAPKVGGFTRRETYKAELVPIVGKMQLIKAVACVCARKCKCQGNAALAGLLEPNMPALNSMARAQKENLNIPGVRAVPESTGARGR